MDGSRTQNAVGSADFISMGSAFLRGHKKKKKWTKNKAHLAGYTSKCSGNMIAPHTPLIKRIMYIFRLTKGFLTLNRSMCHSCVGLRKSFEKQIRDSVSEISMTG